jgi:3-hydroxyacyl-CoA dehydrogenase
VTSSEGRGRIAIVGGGSIGVAWAIVFARAGHPVRVHDVDTGRLSAVTTEIRSRLDDLVAHGLLTREAAGQAAARVAVTADLGRAVQGAIHVQECVSESLDVKRAVFAELDRRCDPGTVLASSSSMIPCSRFAAELPGRHRCLVVHPGNPPYLLPVAEVVPAPFTSAAVVTSAMTLLRAVGMTPVDVRQEVEGFVFNRLQGAVLREAYCLVRDGIAGVADVDAVVRLGLGRRWSVLGPFATSDLNTRGGIERHAMVMGPAYARMGAERGQHDPWTPELVARVAAELHVLQPLSAWDSNVRRRDQALMRSLATAAADPGPIAGTAPTDDGCPAAEPTVAGSLLDLRSGRRPERELAAAWSALAPAGLTDLIGTWRGGLYDTGHPHNRRADPPRWFGKRITSIEDAWPDLVVDADGAVRATDTHGRLATVEFRGEATASLVYDAAPVMDHFKKVDDDTMLGVMSRREDRESGSYLYFWLDRVPDAG